MYFARHGSHFRVWHPETAHNEKPIEWHCGCFRRKGEIERRIESELEEILGAEKKVILEESQEAMNHYGRFIEETKTAMQAKYERLRNLTAEEGKMLLDQFAETYNSTSM
jgi:hypothetical protein